MTKRPSRKTKEPTPPVYDGPEDRSFALRDIGGSPSDKWNETLLRQVLDGLWVKHSSDNEQVRQGDAICAALLGIAPRDELEGMMAAQLIAAHNASMECYRRAMIADQTSKGRHENLNQANKLSRTWSTLLDALNKYRGKGQQKVTVEHVHVHAGGQAVVGSVELPGGGDQSRTEEQSHAKQIEHAPEPTLRREDAQGDTVRLPGNGQRPLSDAWG